jgi:hypothetical protein
MQPIQARNLLDRIAAMNLCTLDAEARFPKKLTGDLGG